MDLLLYILAIVIVLIAQGSVQGAYQKYRRVPSERNMTGEQVARRILDNNGLNHVRIEYATGMLGDHYDPRSEVVRLSKDVYDGSSIASVSIAAHEVGHAIQHAENYGFIALRNSILPVTQISSNMAWPILIMGLLFNSGTMLYLGIFLLVIVLIFQVVTLPVEFNASSRAIVQLENEDIIYGDETKACKKMLSAAAMTYVAAVAAAALQILRMLIIARSND